MNIFSDHKGDPSSYRVVFVLWMVALIVCVIFLTVSTDKMPDIPQSIVELVGGLIAGKVLQYHAENKAPDNNVAPTQ